MIQIYTVTAPLGDKNPADVETILEVASHRIMTSFPPLRGADVKAAGGVLTLTLRVIGRNRWDVSNKARKIATSMLGRVHIPVSVATMELTETPPTAHTLTKDTGRNLTNHRPRGASKLAAACEDPS